MFITGESYGGIYVPYLAWRIIHDSTQKFNLKGIIVGNGATDFKYDVSPVFPELVHGLNLIPTSLYNEYNANNCTAYFYADPDTEIC